MSSNDVVTLIETDHREMERLFELLKSKPGLRRLYLPVLSSLLVAHSRAEESAVYPVGRAEAGQTEEVAHSQEEHVEAEQKLHELMALDPGSSDFESTLQEVIDSVNHHVEEEESSVLPGIRKHLSEDRRMELAEAFAAARADHLGEQPGEELRSDLAQQADNMGVEGTGAKTKEELKKSIS